MLRGLALFFLIVWNSQAWANYRQGVVLIYDGPGVCAESCADAAALVVQRMGLPFAFVKPEEMNDPSVFDGAIAWIQPGGEAWTMAEALGEYRLGLIRNFIAAGGSYLGICAGAFLAGQYVDDDDHLAGLRIIPYSVYEYPSETGYLPVYLYNQARYMYFEEGPFFPPMLPEFFDLGYYGTGEAAAVATTYGHGRVVLSAVHPEAMDFWQRPWAPDPDGLDHDVMIEWLYWLVSEP